MSQPKPILGRNAMGGRVTSEAEVIQLRKAVEQMQAGLEQLHAGAPAWFVFDLLAGRELA